MLKLIRRIKLVKVVSLLRTRKRKRLFLALVLIALLAIVILMSSSSASLMLTMLIPLRRLFLNLFECLKADLIAILRIIKKQLFRIIWKKFGVAKRRNFIAYV